MAVKFRVMPRKNLQDLTAPQKYYATLKSSGTVNIKEMIEDIREFTSLSEPDILSVISALRMEIQKAITQGKSIRWDNFGSFTITLSSEGCDKEEDVTAERIKKTVIHFRAGEDLANTLKNLKYQKEK